MKLRLFAVSLNQTPLDWSGNFDRMVRAIEQARLAGAHLICFPELCVSGYGAEDAFFWPETRSRSLAVLDALAPLTRGLVVSVGLPIASDGFVYNANAVLCDGRVLGFACKRHLAKDGLHYEPRWFTPWPIGEVRQVWAGASGLVPGGDLIFEVGGVRFGFEICEDAWVSSRPGAELAAAGADIILNPSASHFSFGKDRRREALVVEGSREFASVYVYANLVGNEAGRSIYDGDVLIAEQGQLARVARRFSFAERQVLACDVEITRKVPPFSEIRPTIFGSIAWAEPEKLLLEADRGVDPKSPRLSKEQELASAIALGLFDYARKSKSRGFVVSLSGGADSAACALLVRYMVRLAVNELGLERSRAALGHPEAADESELIALTLITVYQATENSGSVTRAAASALARELGSTHHEVDVNGLFYGYRDVAARILGRDLEWPGDDLALQNLQARVRAPSVWTIANVRGALLISTSNRSEAAVGYATMDGDTAGGLAPIAGVDKHFIRSFLRWAEREGPQGLGPISALRFVNEQAPTAELRPTGAAQTDEKDLMPYDVLDAIERSFVQARRGPRHVLSELGRLFPDYDEPQLFLWVERFFQLFSRNQWKRERYAPSFHLDDLSLDPKTWCRFPILSGGFADELAELRAEVGTRGGSAKS